jgi:hypothetical protein
MGLHETMKKTLGSAPGWGALESANKPVLQYLSAPPSSAMATSPAPTVAGAGALPALAKHAGAWRGKKRPTILHDLLGG